MKHIYLHVGLPKTGTTAIQWFLRYNKEALEKSGIGFYVPKGSKGRDGRANGSFLYRKVESDLYGTDYESIRNYHEYKIDFTTYAKRFDKLVLSEELFCIDSNKTTRFWQTASNYIREMIAGDCMIHPIIYLRRQDEWILSLWKEQVRNSNTELPDNDGKEVCGLCDFHHRLKIMESVFGKSAIIVRPYDRKRFTAGDICIDFLDAIGIRRLDEFIFYKKNRRHSLTLNAAEAMRLIWQGKSDCNTVNDNFRKKLRKTISTDEQLRNAALAFSLMFLEKKDLHYMEPEERRAFLDQYIDGNKAISERYLNGEPLFNNEIEPYQVWRPDYNRDIQNAEFIIELAQSNPLRVQQIIDVLLQ